MADLSQLFNVAPISASFMLGQNNALDQSYRKNQTAELAQQIAKLQQERAQSDQMNPLKMQYQQLLNQTAQAKLPEIEQDVLTKRLANQGTEGTLASTISEKNADNANKVEKLKYDAMGRISQAFVNSAPELEQVPAPARTAYLMNKLNSNGIDTKHPFIQDVMQRLSQNPDAMPQALTTIGEKMGKVQAMQNPAYLSHVKGAEIGADATIESAKIHGNATLGAAKIGADSRAEVASIRASSAAEKQENIRTFQAAGVKAAMAARNEPDKTKRDALEQQASTYFTAAQSLAAAGRNGQIDSAAMVGAPTLQAPNPFAQDPDKSAPSATDAGSLRARVEASGEKYDPGAYEYRIGPNGKVQKKAKGK